MSDADDLKCRHMPCDACGECWPKSDNDYRREDGAAIFASVLNRSAHKILQVRSFFQAPRDPLAKLAVEMPESEPTFSLSAIAHLLWDAQTRGPDEAPRTGKQVANYMLTHLRNPGYTLGGDCLGCIANGDDRDENLDR